MIPVLLPGQFASATRLSEFDEILENSSDAAETMARLLYEVLDGILSGPEGVAQTINSLKDGIEYAYQYTEAHKLGLKLYLLYLDGKLEPSDEPERLLSRAVERGIILTRKIETQVDEE